MRCGSTTARTSSRSWSSVGSEARRSWLTNVRTIWSPAGPISVSGMTSCRAQFVPRERRRRTIAPEATLSAAKFGGLPVQRASEPGSACAAAYPAGVGAALEEKESVAPRPGHPLLERHPPVFARAEHPRDEDVGEAALAQVRCDYLDELTATGVGAIVLVRREDARRAGDDQAVGVAGDRVEILSPRPPRGCPARRAVRRAGSASTPARPPRPRLHGPCACSEECVHSRRGRDLDAPRRSACGPSCSRGGGIPPAARRAGLVRGRGPPCGEPGARLRARRCPGLRGRLPPRAVRVEPGKRRRGVLPRHLVSEEEEPDQRVERLPVGNTLKENGDVGGASVELAVDAEPLLQALGGVAGRDEQRAQRRNGPGVVEACSGVGRCVRAHEDTWGIRYRCRARGVAQPG